MLEYIIFNDLLIKSFIYLKDATSFIFMSLNIPKVICMMYDRVACNFQLLPAPAQNK